MGFQAIREAQRAADRKLRKLSPSYAIAKQTNKMSKGDGYLNRVYSCEYDLSGMIEAYDVSTIVWAAREIAEGNIDMVRAHFQSLAECTNASALDDALNIPQPIR
jgi:hypothetical protein